VGTLTKLKNDKKNDKKNDNTPPDGDGDKEFKERLAKLDEWLAAEKLRQQLAYIDRKISHKQYLDNIEKLDTDYFTKKAALERKAGKSDAETQMKALANRLKLQEEADKKMLELSGKTEKLTLDQQKKQAENFEKLWNDIIKNTTKIIAEQYKNINKQIQDELDEEQRKRLEKHKNDFDKLEQYIPKNPEQKRDEELAALDALREENLISEQNYVNALIGIWGDYFSHYAQMALQAVNSISSVSSALQEAETARMNAEYEKRLTAAGDNAEEREKIEEERAREEIEIQKKYADANFALQVVQISVSGLLAAMDAYKSLAGIPFVGPALGAAAAAAVGIMTLAQIAKAKAERDKIKSISYSGSASASGTSERVIVPGLEQGGYPVKRRHDGKNFNADFQPDKRGYINRPTVLVAENGGEFVANNLALGNPTVKPVLDIIDIAQKHGTIATINLPAELNATQIPGHQAGGYTTPQTGTAPPQANKNLKQYNDSPEILSTLTELKELLKELKNHKFRGYIVYSDIEKAGKLKKQADELGNLK
jgi:hypothetical protein